MDEKNYKILIISPTYNEKENIHPKSENSNLAEARTEYNIAVFKRLFFKKIKSLEYISQDGH